MKQNWISIVGKTSFEDGILTHIPLPPDGTMRDSAELASQSISLARSNIEFEQGTISFEVQFERSDARCQIGLAGPAGGEIYSGLNVLGTAYGFATFRNSQWEPGGGAGLGDSLAANMWHKLELRVKGSNLVLYFNEVKVASKVQQVHRGNISLLLQSDAEIQVRKIHVETQTPICFVVMQFTDEYNELYKEVIHPTCESFKFHVIRADDFYTTGLIINDITQSISESALVIAEITPDNPNVFYEVGYAHGIGKPTILLCDRQRSQLPFDVSGFRTLFYDNTIGGKGAVEERLRKHLQSIIS